MPLIRVGDPLSPVKVGQTVPDRPDQVYQAGQFAPSLDELATLSLAAAKKAALLDDSLPIYNDDGEVDEKKLKEWNPSEDFRVNGKAIGFTESTPKVAAATLVSLNKKFPQLFSSINLTAVVMGTPHTQQEEQMLQQLPVMAGKPILEIQTSFQNQKFKSKMLLFPDYYSFVAVPRVPAVSGRSAGLSLSAYATLSAIGNAILSKLSYEEKYDLIGAFSSSTGWSKGNSGEAPSFLGRSNQNGWTRDSEAPIMTELAKYSMVDDFAETFANYMTNRMYLKATHPQKVEAMDEIMQYIGG